MAVHCQDGWLCHLHRPSCRLHSHNSGFAEICTHDFGHHFLEEKIVFIEFFEYELIFPDLCLSLGTVPHTEVMIAS